MIDKALTRELAIQSPDRMRVTGHAMRFGFSDNEIYEITSFDPWFLARIREIIETETIIKANGLPEDELGIRRLKMMGFSDGRLAILTGRTEKDIRETRKKLGLWPYSNASTPVLQNSKPKLPICIPRMRPLRWALANVKPGLLIARKLLFWAVVQTGLAKASNLIIAAATPAIR